MSQTALMEMNQSDFLDSADASDFITWLCSNLGTLQIELRVRSSRFVPEAVNESVSGVEPLLDLYRWKNRWYDNGEPVDSCDWPSTQRSLERLRNRLLDAVADADENRTLDACLAVLKWGGVSGATTFLRNLHRHGRLVGYLQAGRGLFDYHGEQSLDRLDHHSIPRFDAGLTKIHSLLDTGGSPIYDSRVGAAIAMLYALYRRTSRYPALLAFPSGPARGAQIRNPGDLDPSLPSAPQFFTSAVSSQYWARYQVILGWIIRQVLKRTSLFAGAPSAVRSHSLEAALFIIGYDLRCLWPTTATTVAMDVDESAFTSQALAQLPATRDSTWVPSSFPLRDVLDMYYQCSKTAGSAVSEKAFGDWLVAERGYTTGAASAYRFPLKPYEFDLPNRSLEGLETLLAGGWPGLLEATGGNAQFIAGEEREHVCLMDTLLLGLAKLRESQGQGKASDLLQAKGFAGTTNSANTLCYVGRAVGRHFDLLDAQDLPTESFQRFFADVLLDPPL